MSKRQWTDEQRREQAARIRALKPWLKSTGPRTVEGKRRSARNNEGHASFWSKTAFWSRVRAELGNGRGKGGGPKTPEGRARSLRNLKQFRSLSDKEC